MQQVYERWGTAPHLTLLTAFLSLTGCLSLIMSGELTLAMTLPAIGIFFGYYRLLRGMQPAPRVVISSLSVAAVFLLIFDWVTMTNDFFISVAHMTIVFQAIKSFDLKEPWDYLQVYFMSLLQLIITSELTHSIIFAVAFVVFLIALIIAIVISHFIKEGTLKSVRVRMPLVFISLITLIVTSVFFISVPRTGAGLWGRKSTKGIRSVGFSEKVEFGSFGDVLNDSTIVMRVELSGMRLPLYWRGVTLDYFDGSSWKDTVNARFRLRKSDGRFVVGDVPDEERLSSVQKVFMEPMDTDVVFGLADVAAVEFDGRWLETDGEGALFYPLKRDRRFAYTAYSGSGGGMPVRVKRRYLEVPSGMARISGLAREAAGRAKDDLERARLIEGFLKTNYRYSLKTDPVPSGVNPVEDFLFNSKKGFCEHYATAMTLMLRTLGVPARIVIGFAAGEENSYGNYVIVRQSNAHSWVEAAIEGRWQRFDPTPASRPEIPGGFSLFMDSMRMKWYRYVVGFSSHDQKRMMKYIALPFLEAPRLPEFRRFKWPHGPYALLYLLPAMALMAAGLLFLLKRRKRYNPETLLYLRVKNRIRRRGGDVGPSSTPNDVSEEARRLGMDIREFIGLYSVVRFGGIKLDAKARKQYRELGGL